MSPRIDALARALDEAARGPPLTSEEAQQLVFELLMRATVTALGAVTDDAARLQFITISIYDLLAEIREEIRQRR